MTEYGGLGMSNEAAEKLIDLQANLFKGEPVRGLRYVNTMISGPGSNDNFDPDLVYKPSMAAGYWPDGGFEGHSYAAALLNKADGLNPNEERTTLRRLILDAHIGAAALARHNKFIADNPAIAELSKNAGRLLIPTFLKLCATKANPFVFLVSGPVVKSKVIPPGDRIASIYYPLGVPPKIALANLRRALVQTQAEETL